MEYEGLNKVTVIGDYLAVPFMYGADSKVTLFIPISFIETGTLDPDLTQPNNFFGVDLKFVLDKTSTKRSADY